MGSDAGTVAFTFDVSRQSSPSPLWGEGARRAGEGKTPQVRTQTHWPAAARWASLAFALLATTVAAGATWSAPPASDALLQLVPPDAAVIVTVDHLRDHAAAFLKSTLAADLNKLPAVQAWFASEKYRQFERSRTQIEAHLGVNLTDLRDQLLGDAVILALRLPPDAPPDASQARGLLLFEARDLALLNRLIRVVNTTQEKSGELTGVFDRQRNGSTYHAREFPPAAGRPAECYVVFPDGTFAFSNSESMIQSVIDRKARAHDGDEAAHAGSRAAPGLGSLPKLKAVQGQLPGPAVARLFVDPRQFERLLASQPRPSKPTDARLLAILERYLAAVDYAGAALTWSNESIVIHSVETLNASSLDPWIRHWAGDVRPIDPSVCRVPPTALAFASGHLDGVALLDAFEKVVGDEDQPKMANLETMVTGLMLGQDVRTRVLPRLGPGVLAYFDTPPEVGEPGSPPGAKPAIQAGWPFPLVVVVSLEVDPEKKGAVALADAADNALRTILAAHALDEKRHQGGSRITNRTVAGTTVTTLDPAISFAYAVDRARRRLVLSNSPGAVVRYLESAADSAAPGRLRQLRAAAGANVGSFASINLDALNHLAGKHRAGLLQTLAARQERSPEEMDRDLAHVLALARLFRAAFVTTRFEADATAVHRSIGLLRQDEGRK